MAEFAERVRQIREINQRNRNALLREKWWHVYAQALLGVVLTLGVFAFVLMLSPGS